MFDANCLPWLTVKIDFTGLNKNPTVIMIVQILRLFPVIQNMNIVMNICFEGDFANSHAFCKIIILANRKIVQ